MRRFGRCKAARAHRHTADADCIVPEGITDTEVVAGWFRERCTWLSQEVASRLAAQAVADRIE